MLLRSKIPLVVAIAAAIVAGAGLFGLFRAQVTVVAFERVLSEDVARLAESH